MNHFWRRVALVLTAVGLCLSLCSCTQLDTAKANHALRHETDRDTLTMDGKLYRRIPRELNGMLLTECGYITAPDVPVLLGFFLGEPIRVEADGRFLLSFPDDAENRYFCREDLYDDLMRPDPVFDHLMVEYSDRQSKECVEMLDAATTARFQRILVPENLVAGESEDWYYEKAEIGWVGHIAICDESGLLTQGDLSVSIFENHKVYIIQTIYGDEGATRNYYAVPAAEQAAMRAFIERYGTIWGDDGGYEDMLAQEGVPIEPPRLVV